MRKLLLAVLALFALLVVNSAYLGAVTFRQWLSGLVLEDRVYQAMFLGHLVLGIAIIAPVLIYGVMHLRRAIRRPNRLAVRLGLILFGCVIVLLVSGIALTAGYPPSNCATRCSARSPTGRTSPPRSWSAGSSSCIAWPDARSAGRSERELVPSPSASVPWASPWPVATPLTRPRPNLSRALRDLTSESHDSMRHSEKRDEDIVRAGA